uniref:Uncharacterized protein n=1 Tax=Rhizophora mucronata TaxID=61149 RepID=A0A2P2KXI1_RHIMU
MIAVLLFLAYRMFVSDANSVFSLRISCCERKTGKEMLLIIHFSKSAFPVFIFFFCLSRFYTYGTP